MKPLHSLFARLKITPFLPQKPWQIALFAVTGLFVLGVFLAAAVALVLMAKALRRVLRYP